MAFVYFFKHKGVDGIKIGMTNKDDVKQRFDSFNTYSPHGAENLGTIETYDAQYLEKILHKDFEKYRINGEFFNIHPDEVTEIIENYYSIGCNMIHILQIYTPKFLNSNTRILVPETDGILSALYNYYDFGFTIEKRILVNSSESIRDTFIKIIKNDYKNTRIINGGRWFEVEI